MVLSYRNVKRQKRKRHEVLFFSFGTKAKRYFFYPQKYFLSLRLKIFVPTFFLTKKYGQKFVFI